MHKIVISSPEPAWSSDFQALRSLSALAVPHGAFIQHIGSTAVPDLAAKNVIDIQVSVDALDQVDPARLENIGFKQVVGLSDNCPPGMQIPAAELVKLFFKGTARAAHVHIREKGRFKQRYALLCRDFLRTHIVAAEAYGLIKTRLAQRFPDDADAYYDIKDLCSISLSRVQKSGLCVPVGLSQLIRRLIYPALKPS